MLVDEIESDNESNSTETTSLPILRSSYSVPPHNLDWPPTKIHDVKRDSYRSSIQDVSLLDRFVSNVRTSIYGNNLIRQITHRNSSENINAENLHEPQFICEERRDNAIFKIYLKRIRHKTSTPDGSSSTIHQNEPTDNDSGKLYSTTKIYQLKAGTLEKIIECLTNKQGDLDTTHMHILFATYRTFTNTRVLIDTILARYRAVIPASLDMTEDTRQKTLKSLSMALICLLTAYKEDFYEPPTYATLNHLLRHVMDYDLQAQCQRLLYRFLNDEENILKPDFNTTVDDNNNSKNHHPDEYIYNLKGFDNDTVKTFLGMSHVMIAEQLTYMDAELLKRVLPHECLTRGANGNNRRGLNSNRILSSVDKTVEQFNAVVNRVIATILKEQNEQIRVHVIEKWIDIASECRQLKNFSSLTAILNGFSSGCIYRLKTAWSHVSSYHSSILNRLTNIFGNCDDKKQARAILDKQIDKIPPTLPECIEGTAKYVDMSIAINATLGKKLRSKKIRDQQRTMIGTVPYLGLYFCDLTYIDSAYENHINLDKNDKTSPKLINFEKHRKEFEILAQIILFQSAAKAYTTIRPLPYFQHWFDNVRIYDNEESWQLSYQIEPKESLDSTDNQQNSSPTYRSRPLKAFPSEVSLESLATANNQITEPVVTSGGSCRSSPSSTSLDKMSLASTQSFPQRQQSINIKEKKIHSNHSRSSSASSFLTNTSSSQGYMSAQASPANSVANCTFNSVDNDTLIAKVQLVGRNDLLYKKVRIGHNDRAPNVLKSILEKFGLDPSLYDRYCIEQQLPTRKLILPDHCNVFYALVRQSVDEQVELIIREKTRQERDQTKSTGHNRTPSGLSVSSTNSR